MLSGQLVDSAKRLLSIYVLLVRVRDRVDYGMKSCAL